MLNQPTDL